MTIDSFTSTGSHTWTRPAGVSEVDVLIVAGGGGGGGSPHGAGGGGGVGGYITESGGDGGSGIVLIKYSITSGSLTTTEKLS